MQCTVRKIGDYVTSCYSYKLCSRVFQSCVFHPCKFGPAFSSPAFSTPAIWSLVFQSRVFHSCYLVPRFPVLRFPVPRFQSPPGCLDCLDVLALPLVCQTPSLPTGPAVALISPEPIWRPGRSIESWLVGGKQFPKLSQQISVQFF